MSCLAFTAFPVVSSHPELRATAKIHKFYGCVKFCCRNNKSNVNPFTFWVGTIPSRSLTNKIGQFLFLLEQSMQLTWRFYSRCLTASKSSPVDASLRRYALIQIYCNKLTVTLSVGIASSCYYLTGRIMSEVYLPHVVLLAMTTVKSFVLFCTFYIATHLLLSEFNEWCRVVEFLFSVSQ